MKCSFCQYDHPDAVTTGAPNDSPERVFCPLCAAVAQDIVRSGENYGVQVRTLGAVLMHAATHIVAALDRNTEAVIQSSVSGKVPDEERPLNALKTSDPKKPSRNPFTRGKS